MNRLGFLLESSIVKKLLMALTGFFLMFFLIGHLAGNLQLLLDNTDGQAKLQFNAYAKFMTTNLLVNILSFVTYLAIILHIIYSILITLYNRKSRPIGYVHGSRSKSDSWASVNMGILGSLILIFLVIHLKSFWYEMHWGKNRY